MNRNEILSADEIAKKLYQLKNDRRILIISSDTDDYEQFSKYFANIDYFKSIVRAEKYFAEHPKTLKEYSIIILGKNKVLNLPADEKDLLTLPDKIKARAGKALVAEITKNAGITSELTNYEAKILPNSKISMSEVCYKFLVEGILAEAVRKKIANNFPKASYRPSITCEVKPEIPLVSKTTNLKVLIVGPLAGKDEKEKETRRNIIKNKLYMQTGIYVEYVESSPTSFSSYVRDHLGDYDIIINDGSCLGNVSAMDEESTEQCKDTGRQLTVLMNYYSRLLDANKRCSDFEISFGGTEITKPHKDRKLKPERNEISAQNEDDSLIEALASMLQQAANIYQEKANYLDETRDERKVQAAKDTEIAIASSKKQELLRKINEILTIAKRYLNQDRTFNFELIQVIQTDGGIHIYNWRNNKMISSLMLIESSEGITIRIATSDSRKGLTPIKDLFIGYTSDEKDVLPNDIQESTISGTLTRIKEYIEEPLNKTQEKKRKKKKKETKRKYPN